MNYLSIDYGTQHIGIAIATTPLAEPLKTIPAKDAIETIIKLTTQHKIDHIVIGLSENQMAQTTTDFAHQLSAQTQLPIHLHDETLTSQTASQKLSHAKKKTKRGPDHHFAAALILQDYLDNL